MRCKAIITDKYAVNHGKQCNFIAVLHGYCMKHWQCLHNTKGETK